MNESGINSFEEFVLFYAAVTLLIGALWVMLEADVLLAPVADWGRRRARQRPLLHLLVLLGALHPACSLVVMDACRRDPLSSGEDGAAPTAARAARYTAVAGVAVFAVACAPHVPVLQDLPGVDGVVGVLPWE